MDAVNERPPLQQGPPIEELSTDEAVALLTRVYGESEETARLMVAIAKGEIEGDAFAVTDDSDASDSSGSSGRRA